MWWILVGIFSLTIRFFLHKNFNSGHQDAAASMALELEVDVKEHGRAHLPQYS